MLIRCVLLRTEKILCVGTIVTLIFISTFSRATGESVVVIDDFEKGLKKEWQRKHFQRNTVYTVIETGQGHVLRAVSNSSATGLIYEYEYDLKDYPFLTWRWKVENTVKNGDEKTKEGDDYAARVYVIFPHWFKPLTKSINYIWANKLEKGEFIPNAFYSKAIMIAVQSREENVGEWITERRNVYEDFKLVFGQQPPKVGAIAIMTDTDNTGESAVAYYDDIRLEAR